MSKAQILSEIQKLSHAERREIMRLIVEMEVMVEKHRPRMNKLTNAQRQRLRRRAAELLYGREALAPGR